MTTTDRQMKLMIAVTIGALALGVVIGRATKQTHVYRFEGPGAEAMNKMADNWAAPPQGEVETPRVTPPLPEAPLSGMRASRVQAPASGPTAYFSQLYPGGVPMPLKVPIDHPIMTMPLPCGHLAMSCDVTPSGAEVATCVDMHFWARWPSAPRWSGKPGDAARVFGELSPG